MIEAPMVQATDISVRFGVRLVLDSVSFTVSQGQLVAVLGPNGAGKSTLLRVLAGLVPFSGDVRLGGERLAELRPLRRAKLAAFLPQGHEAHWPILARDAVAIGRIPYGAHPGRLAEADYAAVERALAAVDAAHLADRPVTELSGGERARVMLARALAVEARLLLADEPIAALDPQHQLAVMQLLKTSAGQGRTVLVALHELTLAARFADRVLVLEAGLIVADGAPLAVLTPELLARVFGIAAITLTHGGQPVLVPWSTGNVPEADSRR